jgi:hypothetical protein
MEIRRELRRERRVARNSTVQRDADRTLTGCSGGWPNRSDWRLMAEALIGAGEGIRTLDPDLGKVVLYP